MGFSLELFFEMLNQILKSSESDIEKLDRIADLVDQQERYAKTCGLIK